MSIDNAIKYVFNALENRELKWHNPIPDEGRFFVYYAEGRLYVVRDSFTNGLYFIKANDPADACVRARKEFIEQMNKEVDWAEDL